MRLSFGGRLDRPGPGRPLGTDPRRGRCLRGVGRDGTHVGQRSSGRCQNGEGGTVEAGRVEVDPYTAEAQTSGQTG